MKTHLAYQPQLLDTGTRTDSSQALTNARSGSFGDNMSLPVHRWYRYSAGFSADWVRTLVQKQRGRQADFRVLDPFCGVGTTLLACDAEGVESSGFEPHPFVHRVASAKVRGIQGDPSAVMRAFQEFTQALPSDPLSVSQSTSPLLTRCYSPATLAMLLEMKRAFLADFDKGTPASELLWLAITAILRSCSGVGTAQWQYILPNKNKSGALDPVEAFRAKAIEIIQDIDHVQRSGWHPGSQVLLTDARSPDGVKDLEFDMVVTSPPYPNNYDYADATRLEMTFWGDIHRWADLQHTVRRHLIHSCSQHAAAERLVLEDLLASDILDPIRMELSQACLNLAQVRTTKGGRKNYHTMAAAYFRDLGHVFASLRPLCRSGSLMCFVIGDSAPYGVYLDVVKWLGELALAAGFKSYSFEKIRDRNVKWKNRKHRVPLQEGRLWIEG